MNDQNRPAPSGFNFGHLLLALVSGAAAGAAAAYLTAPRSGEETRHRLQDAADDTREAVSRVPLALQKATEAARQAFNEAIANGARES